MKEVIKTQLIEEKSMDTSKNISKEVAEKIKKNPETENPENNDKIRNSEDAGLEEASRPEELEEARNKLKNEYLKSDNKNPEQNCEQCEMEYKKPEDYSKNEENFKDTAADLHIEKIPKLLKQLIADFGPESERLNIDIDIKNIDIDDIESFCRENDDMNAYKKMLIHDIPNEPIKRIIAISEKDKNIDKKNLEKLLVDLGYNVNVLISKRFGCDYDAATNINGYSIPGWEKLVNFVKKYNRNFAIFLGKRFAPGKSRLHIHVYEGKNYTYIIPHVDEFNWINTDIKGVRKSHVGSGVGDNATGSEYFLKSLKEYLKL